jgi:Protein of unknown function (DUF3465)
LKNSKYLIGILLVGLLIAQWALNEENVSPTPPATESHSQTTNVAESQSPALKNNLELQEAFDGRKSNLWLVGSGEVIKILPDDDKGSRHQRILVKVNLGQTVLIAHNIDLAERVANLQAGDMIQFYGEYEWNEKGGVVHWTHHDPAGKKTGGWIKHNNIMYQ